MEIKEQVEKLIADVKALQLANAELKSANQKLKEKELARLRRSVLERCVPIGAALESGDALAINIDGLLKDLDEDKLYDDLLGINNINSATIGESFKDTLLSEVENILTASLKEEESRSVFSEAIKKIVNNPIVEEVLELTPITALVNRVIDKARNFFSETQAGKVFKRGALASKDRIAEVKFREFERKITVHLKFYEQLKLLREAFKTARLGLEDRIQELIKIRENFYSDLLKTMNYTVDDGPAGKFGGLRQQLASAPEYELTAFLSSEKYNVAFEQAQKYVTLLTLYDQLQEGYKKIYGKYLQGYQDVIKERIESKMADRDKAQKVLDRINDYKTKHL